MPNTRVSPPCERRGCGNRFRTPSLNRDYSEILEIQTLRARIAKMSEASRRITESLDLDSVLQEVVDGARSLTGAR